jgi:diguanylate cyclase (GGDEF)-like protein/PAS domain S-box-containing protein
MNIFQNRANIGLNFFAGLHVFIFVFLLPLQGFCKGANVLILHSYHQEYPWTKNQNEGFVQTLMKVEPWRESIISTEYLDTKRQAFTAEYKIFFVSYLVQKYQNYIPDIIFCTDDNALDFLMSYKEHLFPGVPVVFSGVNNLAVQNLLDSSQYVGVYEKKELAPNVRIARQINPAVKKIIFIGDDSSTYWAIKTEAQKELAEFFPEMETKFLEEKAFSQLIKQLKGQDGGAIFLTTVGGFFDDQKRVLPLDKVIETIRTTGDHMIISMEDAYMKRGVLGGYVTHGYSQGREAAKIALRVLNGAAASEISSVQDSPNVYIFDYEQLQKYKVDKSVLPRGSIILSEPVSLYYQYKKYIWFVVAFLLVQSLAILLLWLSIVKRKRVEHELKLYREHLESRVAERTTEITHINEQLLREINERRLAEHTIQQKNNYLHTVIESFSYPFYVVDAENYAIVMANSAACRKTGNCVGRFCYTHTHMRDVPCGGQEHVCPLHEVIKTGKAAVVEHIHYDKDGKEQYVEVSGFPVFDEKGKIVQMIEYVVDITERKRMEKKFHELSIKDELTEIYNRRGFMELAGKQLHIAKRSKENLFLLYIDVDNMKWINDSLGHQIGDQALTEIASILRKTFRQSDIIARMGGDEFVVMITDEKGQEDEASILQRLQRSIGEENAKTGRQYELQVSVGTLRCDYDRSCSLEELLSAADNLMYEEKVRKKGRTTH